MKLAIVLACAAGLLVLTAAAATAAAPASAQDVARIEQLERRIDAVEQAQRFDDAGVAAADKRREGREIDALALQRESAGVAWLQFWTSGATLVGLLISLLATYAALRMTKNSLDLARQTAHAELSPQLGMIGFNGFGIGPADKKVASWTLKNHGTTSARDIRIRPRIEYCEGVPETHIAWFPDENGNVALSLLAPGAENVLSLVILETVSQTNLDRALKGDGYLLFRIVVKYKDVFGNEQVLRHSENRWGPDLVATMINQMLPPPLPGQHVAASTGAAAAAKA